MVRHMAKAIFKREYLHNLLQTKIWGGFPLPKEFRFGVHGEKYLLIRITEGKTHSSLCLSPEWNDKNNCGVRERTFRWLWDNYPIIRIFAYKIKFWQEFCYYMDMEDNDPNLYIISEMCRDFRRKNLNKYDF